MNDRLIIEYGQWGELHNCDLKLGNDDIPFMVFTFPERVYSYHAPQPHALPKVASGDLSATLRRRISLSYDKDRADFSHLNEGSEILLGVL